MARANHHELHLVGFNEVLQVGLRELAHEGGLAFVLEAEVSNVLGGSLVVVKATVAIDKQDGRLHNKHVQQDGGRKPSIVNIEGLFLGLQFLDELLVHDTSR